MAERKPQKKIVKYRKYTGINVGTVLFGFLFIYMVVCMVLYLTSSHTTPYEVTKGTLSGNYKYTALALKSETIVEAPESGSVIYYAREGTEIGADGAVCSIREGIGLTGKEESVSPDSSSTEETETISGQDVSEGAIEELSGTDKKKLRAAISSYSMNFSGQDFQKAYEMKADVESAILDIHAGEDEYGNSMMTDSGMFNLCRASQPGIVVYSTDNFESVQPEDVTLDMFDMKSYSKENLRLDATARSGQPLYKMITDEAWSLIIPIDSKLASELTDQTSVTIRFLKDSTTASPDVSVIQNGNIYFAKLDMNDSVVRFASDRFLEIELLLNKKTGLKIPKSAIAEKKFYVIPEEYVIYDEDNEHEITLIRESYDNSGKTETRYITATVYEKVDDKYYVDINLFSEGDYVIKKDSNNKYRIEETATLQGVYNINKGYAVFREITILADNEEYCIVEEGTTFGLAQYDHIALDADSVSDDQIL